MLKVLPINSIGIRPDRQRKNLGDLESLSKSLQTVGQIQPIIIEIASLTDEVDWWLIAGERRLTAAKKLGWETIEAIQKTDLSDHMREAIELEENLRRKQLEWPEEIRAVKRLTILKDRMTVANDLSISPTTISAMVTLADNLDENPKLLSASSWRSAYDSLQILLKRASDGAVEDIIGAITSGAATPAAGIGNNAGQNVGPVDGTSPDRTPIVPGGTTPAGTVHASPLVPEDDKRERPFSAVQADFREWVQSYTGPRFNLIHCDFPYGLNMDTSNLQKSSHKWSVQEDGKYDDSPELFQELFLSFTRNQKKFITDTAHLIFWVAHKHYNRTAQILSLCDWTVCETPLIWYKSDGVGMAPDVRRWPRRNYEMAIFASKGDRKILKVKNAAVSNPTTKEHHLSEKPMNMLLQFMEMVVDEHSSIFDPTCGSGTSLDAARSLGASRALGLDILGTHVEFTNERLAKPSAHQRRASSVSNIIDSIIAD